MQKRPKGKHGVEIVLHQTELIQLQVLDCNPLVLKLEKTSFRIQKMNDRKKNESNNHKKNSVKS